MTTILWNTASAKSRESNYYCLGDLVAKWRFGEGTGWHPTVPCIGVPGQRHSAIAVYDQAEPDEAQIEIALLTLGRSLV